MIKIIDFIATDYVLLTEGAIVSESLAKAGDSGKILVMNNRGNVRGIVPRGKLAEWCKEFPDMKVIELMEQRFLVINKDNNSDSVLEELLTSKQDLLPVVDNDDKLVGVLDKVSILRYLIEKSKSIVEQSALVLNATHDGIIAIDNLGRVTTINAAAEYTTQQPVI